MSAHAAWAALAALSQRLDASTDQPVPSPCTSVCRMDPGSSLCLGCLRTIDEIVAWSRFDDEAKRAVWRLIAQRAHRSDAPTVAPKP